MTIETRMRDYHAAQQAKFEASIIFWSNDMLSELAVPEHDPDFDHQTFGRGRIITPALHDFLYLTATDHDVELDTVEYRTV